MFKNIFSRFLVFSLIFFNKEAKAEDKEKNNQLINFLIASSNLSFGIFAGSLEFVSNILNHPEKMSNNPEFKEISPRLHQTFYNDAPSLWKTINDLKENKNTSNPDFFYRSYFSSKNKTEMNVLLAIAGSWIMYRLIKNNKFHSMIVPTALFYLLLLNQFKNKY